MDLSEREISRTNLMKMTYILGGLALVFVLFQDTRAIDLYLHLYVFYSGLTSMLLRTQL